MRHEQLKLRESFEILDAAAIRPLAAETATASVVEEAAVSTPAVPDVPAAVGRMLIGIYALLIAAFALTMARGLEASFMIAISGLYVAIYLGVPAVFLRIENDRSRRPDLDRFLREGLDTWTGRVSGDAALVQIFVVPLMLAVTILTIGLIGRVIL